MTVSNIQRMSESSEIGGRGTSAAVALATLSIGSPAIVSPVEEGGGGATSEGTTLGRLELALN